MHDHVRQRLAQGFMYQRLVFALALFESKRHLQIRSQFGINPAIEVVEIARPLSIQREPVNPALLTLRFGALLIVEHVVGQFLLNHRHLAEHQ